MLVTYPVLARVISLSVLSRTLRILRVKILDLAGDVFTALLDSRVVGEALVAGAEQYDDLLDSKIMRVVPGIQNLTQ